MPRNSQLSRWGAITKILDGTAPSARAFFVSDSDNDWHADLVNEFPPDEDGVIRTYSSIFDSTMLTNADASRGDVILVMPGHTESITTDQSVTVNGLRFIGLGEGNNRPTIQYDDTAGSVSLDTGNIQFENFRFLASVSGITRGVDIASGADGSAVRRSSFQFDSSGDDFIVSVRANGPSNVALEDNEVLMENAAGPTDAFLLNSADHASVRRNFIYGDFTNGAVTFDTDASAGARVEENEIFNTDSDGVCVNVGATSDPLVSHNNLATGDTVSNGIAAGGGMWVENYVVNDTGETAVVVPTTAAQLDT